MNWASSGIIRLTESYSTCITLRKLLNELEEGDTLQFISLFNSLSNANVLDMPVTAVILCHEQIVCKFPKMS